MSKALEVVSLSRQWAADPAHGYDQEHRDGPDYDCSSLLNNLWEAVGVHVMAAGATYTGNMLPAYLKCGFVRADVDADDLSIGAGLMPGDVLLNELSHAALYIGNGRIIQASINELGTTTGGKTGDQTGTEICERGYYNYPWSVVLRYTGDGAYNDGVYVTVKGDTFWDIAGKVFGDNLMYLDLMRWNGYEDGEILYPGTVLTLRPPDCKDCVVPPDPGVPIEGPSPLSSELLAIRGFMENIIIDLGGTVVWKD